jgi:hypothetical protein
LTKQAQTCSETVGNGLWHQAPAYSPAGPFAVGFSTHILPFEDVKTGVARPTSLGHYDAALVLYGYVFNAVSSHCGATTASSRYAIPD